MVWSVEAAILPIFAYREEQDYGKKKKVNLLVYYTVSPFDKHVLTNPFFIRITNCIRKD